LVPGQKVAYISTLASTAKVAGKHVVHVKFEVSIPLVEHPGRVDSMDVSGDYDVDPALGMLMRGAYTVDNVQFYFSKDTAKVVMSARFDLIGPKANNQSPLLPGRETGKSE
jgi:hypothetical protein